MVDDITTALAPTIAAGGVGAERRRADAVDSGLPDRGPAVTHGDTRNNKNAGATTPTTR
jgi:hypothetical protein